MAKKVDIVEDMTNQAVKDPGYNPLLNLLRENDKKNLFKTNVTTAFHKTGFAVFDHYFGAVVNIHDEEGKIIRQEPRVGQAAGTFNLIIANTGAGKAQPISSNILTPNGWIKMGDIKIGDNVIGWEGTPVPVSGVFPQGLKDIYKVTLEDGRSCMCTAEHLWRVYNKVTENWYVTELKNIIGVTEPLLIPAFKDETLNEIINLKIVNIELDHTEEAQCIYIDDNDHMYVTEDFILTHNTTFASQVAANIMRQYPYSNVIHFDCEERFDVSRCETITKLPASYFENDRYMIRTGAVGLDVIQEMIVKTYVSKKKLKDELMVDSGFSDEFGRPVKIFMPTIVIIDSMTTVMNETFNPENAKEAAEAEKMRGNTEGARDSKTLKGFFKDVLPLCKETNIIIYGINHINANMSMNAFVPVAKQQNYLKQDESIPGGKSMLYYPFNIIKMTAKPSDDFTEEADGFAGHIVMFEPIKSSSNQSGNNSKGISFEMVFSHKYGFDPLRTLIHYGRENGLIEGNKTRMKFKDDDSFTFSLKNINAELKEKPIMECLKKYVIPTLEEHLSYIEPEEVTFNDDILDY